MPKSSCRGWAIEEFGKAQLGDTRRTSRLVAMASEVARNPSGKVTSAFRRSADRQGAYDFLESGHVLPEAILSAATDATCRRASEFPFVFVPIDGTSLNLTDHKLTKDFGSVGSRERGARGLKIVSAVAVSPEGTPLGIATLQWWARGPRHHLSRVRRGIEDKELQHWLRAVDAIATSFRTLTRRTRAWFQLDREGDAQYVLEKLGASGELFTVRSRTDRRLSVTGLKLPGAGRHPAPRRRYLHAYMRRRPSIAHDLLEVPAHGDQPARLARVALRTASVILLMVDKQTSRRLTLPVNVVWVREHRSRRDVQNRSGLTNVRALDWMLLTNHPVDTAEDARRVVAGYTQRWRIEDFHRAWKSGVCNVEDSQLRRRGHVIKWATILASVAARAERLKHLSREQPREAATVELSVTEVHALILLKRRYKKKTEQIGDQTPDLETATRWIAELGGYVGKASGPPGTVTIARGLVHLEIAVETIEAMRGPPRSD